MSRPLGRNADLVAQMLPGILESGGTLRELAEKLGISRQRVDQLARRVGIDTRSGLNNRKEGYRRGVSIRRQWRSFWPRFWSKVQAGSLDECWLWNASKEPSGYGHFKLSGKEGTVQAHRVVMLYVTGHWPERYVLHHCDVRACCNPRHLYEGTQQQNVQDRQERSKTWRERTGRRLTLDEKRRIHRLRNSNGLPIHKIAQVMDVGWMTAKRWSRKVAC